MDGGRLLILDTGPLRELVTFRAVFDLRFEKLRNQLIFLSHPLAYDRFSRFLASFRV
jgi:hypothetical protein